MPLTLATLESTRVNRYDSMPQNEKPIVITTRTILMSRLDFFPRSTFSMVTPVVLMGVPRPSIAGCDDARCAPEKQGRHAGALLEGGLTEATKARLLA